MLYLFELHNEVKYISKGYSAKSGHEQRNKTHIYNFEIRNLILKKHFHFCPKGPSNQHKHLKNDEVTPAVSTVPLECIQTQFGKSLPYITVAYFVSYKKQQKGGKVLKK